MRARLITNLLLLTVLAIIAGCATTRIYVDGMPISNFEYNLTNQETGIRVAFVLVRYHREYEGDEYILMPEYLDALHANRINIDNTESLILHIKVINLKNQYHTLSWEIDGPPKPRVLGLLYGGRLSRKDFYIKLPLDIQGDFMYLFRFLDIDGDDLFDLPEGRYTAKGGN